MTTKDTSGPAFPTTEGNGANSGEPGMTLRQHYAGLAMQAYIATLDEKTPDWRDADQWVPAKSFEMADAMIEAGKS